jgi:hypothetical protein
MGKFKEFLSEENFKDKFNVDSVDKLTLKEKNQLLRIMCGKDHGENVLNKKQLKLGKDLFKRWESGQKL